jgi:hypothetical protein
LDILEIDFPSSIVRYFVGCIPKLPIIDSEYGKKLEICDLLIFRLNSLLEIIALIIFCLGKDLLYLLYFLLPLS